MTEKKRFPRFLRIVLPLGIVLALMSCSAAKTAYLMNCDLYANLPHPEVEVYEVKIQPFDKLLVSAFSEGSEAVSPFNLMESTPYTERNQITATVRPIQYEVEANGMLDLPLIGTVKAEGKTTDELEKEIEEALLGDFFRERPIVTVQIVQYTFAVLGEVASPGMYYTDFDRMNIFEALAKAGDLTIYGSRDKVKVIREYADGKKEIGLVDLNDADVLNSPFFYIQQNDVVYVEPNRAKSHNADIADSSSLWIRSCSIGISLLALIFSLVL